MPTTPTTTDIFRESRKQLVAAAFSRRESVTIIALTIGALCMSLLNLFLTREFWWAVVAAGVAGEAVIVSHTMRDRNRLARISAQMFYRRCDPARLQAPDLQRGMQRTLECHRGLFEVIRQRSGAPLGALASNVDDWTLSTLQLARRIDDFLFDPAVRPTLLQLAERAESARERSLVVITGARYQYVQPAAGGSRSDRVRQTVSFTLNELQASLLAMCMLHNQLQSLSTAQINGDLVQRANSVVSEHMNRLEDADALIDRLHSEHRLRQP
jgi:hypothetical protein